MRAGDAAARRMPAAAGSGGSEGGSVRLDRLETQFSGIPSSLEHLPACPGVQSGQGEERRYVRDKLKSDGMTAEKKILINYIFFFLNLGDLAHHFIKEKLTKAYKANYYINYTKLSSF